MIAGVGMAFALTTLPASAHEAPASLEGLPLLEEVASDAIQISPHVPNMGAHWARESDLSLGPIYASDHFAGSRDADAHICFGLSDCPRW
jgi:hypothetical protein